MMTLIRSLTLAVLLGTVGISAPAWACGPYGAVQDMVLTDADGVERARWNWGNSEVRVPSADAESGWKIIEIDALIEGVQLKDDQIVVWSYALDGSGRSKQVLNLDGTPVELDERVASR